MMVGIIDAAGTRRRAYGIAVPVVVAALRENSTITVYDTDATINRRRLDRRGQLV